MLESDEKREVVGDVFCFCCQPFPLKDVCKMLGKFTRLDFKLHSWTDALATQGVHSQEPW